MYRDFLYLTNGACTGLYNKARNNVQGEVTQSNQSEIINQF